MTEARPQLHLVDASTGEVLEDEREILIAQLEAEKRTQSLQIGKLKKELKELRAVEPEHEDIRSVLSYCNDTWDRKLHIIPASEGWEKVRARLRDRIESRQNQPWTVDELKMAADGALLDPWLSGRDKQSKGYLRPQTVYKSPDKVQELLDLALGFEAKAGLGVGELLEVADELRLVDWKTMLMFCCCGHRRIEHHRPDHEEGCVVVDCPCTDFDESWLDPFNERMRA